MGIDYGRGLTNIDTATRIRYGVISQHSIMPEAMDDFDNDYGEPTCPKCGDVVGYVSDIDYDDTDYTKYRPSGCDDLVCHECKHTLDTSDAFEDEPLGWYLDDGEYQASNCLDSDIIITKSPYYTYAPFCSPCVPGAGNLDNGMTETDGDMSSQWPKTYCFSHDWFESGQAPYRVFRVSDDSEVFPS